MSKRRVYMPVQHIAMDKLVDSPFQPRKEYRKIEELAQSIKSVRLREPILVRHRAGDMYEIVHGHRRSRALRLLSAKYVPCYIEELSDKEAVEIGLVQNIQDEDLNAIEEGEAFKQYIDMFGVSGAELGRRIGKSQNYVNVRLAFLKFPEEIRGKIASGSLGVGYAEELLKIPAETSRGLVKAMEKKDIKSRDEIRDVVTLIRSGTVLEDAILLANYRSQQRMVAKRMVSGLTDLRKLFKEVQDDQQGEDVVRKAFMDSNLQIVNNMIAEGVLVCPVCGKSHFVCGDCGRFLE